jgi:uncharacterized lipoprotein YmbA
MNHSGNKLWPGTLVVTCVAIAQLVSGCVGTSPATRYYAFTSADFISNGTGDTKISVGPFEIPDYLNRPQIVVRDQGTTLKVLKSDRWAEPLTESVNRRVIRDLSNELSSALVYQFPSVTDISPDYRIRGRIHNFEANTDGSVVLRLRWGVLNRENGFAIAPRGENFSTTINSSDDIAAVTNAMDGLLGELAMTIAAELEQIGID